MNRRTLALGGAIALPAGFAAFHAAAGAPPASSHSRPRGVRRDADSALRRAHRDYFASRQEELRICDEPAYPAFSAEDVAQNSALEGAQGRSEEAMREASKLPASTTEGLRLKGVVLSHAMAAAKDFLLDATNAETQLAISIAADIARLIPAAGGQA
jgi:hypothetical protein